jgi:hypothetical protein
MPAASGVFKQLTYKAEVTYGLKPAAASAQSLRRVSSDLSLSKDTFQSNEIRVDQQVQDMRHGVRRVGGTIGGELSPGTYKDFMAAALRRDFTVVTALTALSVTIAGSGPTWTVTRAAGDFLTGGIKRGHVVRLSVGTLNAANINKNLLVTNVTATVLTVRVLNGVALVAEGPIASTTVTVIGKVTFAPTTGHTNQSFSIEHWFADVPSSEVHTGCQPVSIDVQLPPTGLATVSFGIVGKDVETAASQYFTSPTAATPTGLTASVNGLVLINGVAVATLTGLSLQVQSGRSGDPVVGSNSVPTQFPGRITVSGQATAYFEDATLRDAFLNETEMELIVVLSSDNTATSKFVGFTLPRCKLGGSSKSDGEGGIVQTVPFTALLPLTGGSGIANELSTIVVQDSDA